MKRTLNTGVKLSICPFITTLNASDFYAKIGVHFRCLFLLHQIDHVHYQCVLRYLSVYQTDHVHRQSSSVVMDGVFT
jgi:hypothetical protein